MGFREQVADRFHVGYQDICIVGSAKLGFSPSPPTTAAATFPIANGATERSCPAVSSLEASPTPDARAIGDTSQRQASENP